MTNTGLHLNITIRALSHKKKYINNALKNILMTLRDSIKNYEHGLCFKNTCFLCALQL